MNFPGEILHWEAGGFESTPIQKSYFLSANSVLSVKMLYVKKFSASLNFRAKSPERSGKRLENKSFSNESMLRRFFPQEILQKGWRGFSARMEFPGWSFTGGCILNGRNFPQIGNTDLLFFLFSFFFVASGVLEHHKELF